MLRLLVYSLLVFFCLSCSKEEFDPKEPYIEVTRTRVLVDKKKELKPWFEVGAFAGVREMYRVYRHDDQRVVFTPILNDGQFDSIYGSGGSYYLLEVRVKTYHNYQDVGETIHFDRVVSKLDTLENNPFR